MIRSHSLLSQTSSHSSSLQELRAPEQRNMFQPYLDKVSSEVHTGWIHGRDVPQPTILHSMDGPNGLELT